MRQTNHFKNKYAEYKQKLRKANHNIATLMGRIAKYDLQLAAEKENQDVKVPGQVQDNFNLYELMNNDGLDEEIKKLLAEN